MLTKYVALLCMLNMLLLMVTAPTADMDKRQPDQINQSDTYINDIVQELGELSYVASQLLLSQNVEVNFIWKYLIVRSYCLQIWLSGTFLIYKSPQGQAEPFALKLAVLDILFAVLFLVVCKPLFGIDIVSTMRILNGESMMGERENKQQNTQIN